VAAFIGGVIEGFYGRPWSWPAREQMVSFLREQGFNAYVYAPKADRYLRRQWRQSHPAEEFAALRALREHCRRNGVQFGLGLSPWGLQSGYDADDRAALRDKLGELEQLDADLLCILFDDMPGAFAGLAQRQAAVVADIMAASGARRFLMCPTYYSFDPQLEQFFGPMPPRYLEELGAALPAAVEVLWTGPLVLSPGFARADIDAVAGRIGRKPVLWDNYPVNDGRKISRFLHLLPVRGRPAQLRDWCAGHLANPMNQPFLSQLPLASLARSFREGDAYDSERCWRQQLDALAPALAGLLARDAELFQRQGLDQLSAARRAALIDEYCAVGHPAAAEIADWLGEGYRFDPECLND
jgi:hypothetical protein